VASVALSAYLADHHATFSGGSLHDASRTLADGKPSMLDVKLADVVACADLRNGLCSRKSGQCHSCGVCLSEGEAGTSLM
jgi:hypothetical protein